MDSLTDSQPSYKTSEADLEVLLGRRDKEREEEEEIEEELEEEVEEEEEIRYYLPDPSLPMRFRPLKSYDTQEQKYPEIKNTKLSKSSDNNQHISANVSTYNNLLKNDDTDFNEEISEVNKGAEDENEILEQEEEDSNKYSCNKLLF